MGNRLRVGVATDIHYASENYGARYCSDGVNRLSAALDEFERHSVDLILLLGDATDGGRSSDEQIHTVTKISEMLANSSAEVHFVAGNHDLENLGKKEFYDTMWNTLAYPADAMWYEHSYAVDRRGIRFIFLDSHFTEAGKDWADGAFDWAQAHVRSDHLAWAARAAADAPDFGVILVTHENLDYQPRGQKRDPHAIVNHREVWEALYDDADNPVRAVFHGHYHPGRLTHRRRVPLLTFAAMSDQAPPANAFAIADIEDEAISVRGYGRQPSVQILMAERDAVV
jgi:3',5'-cyclic AMP phosphodiesterase CpdA